MMVQKMEVDHAHKMQRCHEYAEALKEEQKKIQVFQRELPLCLELVTQGKLYIIFFLKKLYTTFTLNRVLILCSNRSL